MNWKALGLAVGHAALGAAVPSVLSIAVPALGQYLAAHIDPVTGAIIGSTLTSLFSAFSNPPNKQ